MTDTQTRSYVDALLEDASADYTVTREPAQFRGEDSDRFYWTVRRDTGEDGIDTVTPLEVVGADWRPLQNTQAFDFANAIIPNGDLIFEEIKVRRGGRKVQMTCRVPQDFKIAGEPIDTKIHFINGFDGHTVWGALFSPYRNFCTNQLVFPGYYLPGKPQKAMKVKHTRHAGHRIAAAYRSIQGATEYVGAVGELGYRLSTKRMSERSFDMFLESLVPTRGMEKRALNNAKDRQEEMRGVWVASDNLNNIRDTQWGALQALVEWNDWYRDYGSDDIKQEAIWNVPQYYAEALEWFDKN